MKRVLFLIGLSLLLLRLPVLGQDTGSAAATAANQAADERYNRLAADLQAVQSDNQALHAKLDALEQEIQALRDAQAKPANHSDILDAVNVLAQKIQEVDKKRMEDKDAISDEIHKSIAELEKSIGNAAPPPIHDAPPKEPKLSAGQDLPTTVNGYSYTIAAGDTLGQIVAAYNKDYKSKGLKPITLKQAMEANPNVDWKRLRVGQKIVIPRPDGG